MTGGMEMHAKVSYFIIIYQNLISNVFTPSYSMIRILQINQRNIAKKSADIINY